MISTVLVPAYKCVHHTFAYTTYIHTNGSKPQLIYKLGRWFSEQKCQLLKSDNDMNSQNPCRKLQAAVCICNLNTQQGKGYRPASLDYTQHSSENNETLLQQDRRQGLTLEVCPLILYEQESMSSHTSYTQKPHRDTQTQSSL